MVCHFIDNSESPFYQSALFDNILSFMQRNFPKTQIKETNKKLTLVIQNVPTIEQALLWMERMQRECMVSE